MRKVFFFSLLVIFSLGLVTIYQYVHFHDGKLHVIFCSVGQGDGILIITPNDKVILNDAGPDRSILNCLARHLPFWDRTVDMMVLTHPHADHFFGLFYVLGRYSVKSFMTEDIVNTSSAYQQLLKLLRQKHIVQHYVFASDSLQMGQVRDAIIGPTKEYLEQTSPGGTIGESKEPAAVVSVLSYKHFSVLLTGDSQALQLEGVIGTVTRGVTILQAPHHGSATGLDTTIFDKLSPQLVAISVGLHNPYGHPSPQTLSLLNAYHVPFYRTDTYGDIEIVSDGNGWNIRRN